MSVREAFPEFEKPSVAVDTVILRVKDIEESTNKHVSMKQLQVLLVKQQGNDFWHLPGTILRLGETPNDAIGRIMKNKVNVKDTHFEQLYTVADNVERDKRGHIISIVYIGMHKDMSVAAFADDTEYKSQWFWVGRLFSGQKNREFTGEDTHESIEYLGYDHAGIISDSINRLKGKLMYTDIGFEFIGDMFTLRDLENSFTAINERIIPGFRRFIANKVQKTGIMSDGKAYRPAELYRKRVVTKETEESQSEDNV